MNGKFPRQRGSTLVISLMILIVMTLIGLTGITSSTMEEKMAGNTRDQALAFQAAEAALRDGEAYYRDVIDTETAFNDADGLYKDADHDPFSSATWSDAMTYSGTISDVASQPRYIIERVGPVTIGESNEGLEIKSYGEGVGRPTAARITAQATGGTTNTQVILQSYYSKRLD